MKEITENTEFVIGIDFGHGETSAAYYDLRNEDHMDLDILKGVKVIPSAVAILEQEGHQTISIGEAAVDNAPIAKDFQISFKKVPSKMSNPERKRMISFMKGVYAGILDRHSDFRSREHVVFIARPSQDELWKPEENAYIQLAEEAGIPVAGIQKESRAAYFRARTQPNSKIDNEVKNGVLIVDFGSSTVDFTYLNDKLEEPIDDGRQIGASKVEEILLNYAFSHTTDPNLKEFAERYKDKKDSNPYNQILYCFRKAKEEFYGNHKPFFQPFYDLGTFTASEQNQMSGIGNITIPRSNIEDILGKNKEGGYIESVRQTILDFKKTKLKNQKVARVYLTGGASRMDFIPQLFMEIFNLDSNHCLPDDNPSLIVSQGVAHLSYADIKTKDRETELKEIANSAISNYDWEGNLRNIINESIKAKIIDKAWDIMIAYKNNRVGEKLYLRNDHAIIDGDNKYINMEPPIPTEGRQFVRNIHALQEEFKKEFGGLVHVEFASECEDIITKSIVESITKQLKIKLSAFSYNPENLPPLKLTGLSARVSDTGARQLSNKFTEEGEGHILYDAVRSCFLGIMRKWKLYKDRWTSDREQHYNYYRNNYANIFTSYTWEIFLKNQIIISGVKSAKRQTKDYVDKLIDSYVSYAKLAIFFN